MDLINPITWANSMLTSSTAVDTGTVLWNVATAYTVGQRVRLDTKHKIYECIVANSGASPDANLTGATPKWLEIGATNSFAMFDDKFGTQTTATGSLTVVITPGLVIDSLAFLNLIGSRLTIDCRVGGVLKYSKSISLQTDVGVYDWKTYFLAPIVAEDDVVVTDLLPYALQVITLTITGPSTVAIGNISLGALVSLGSLESSPTVGITDYSKKNIDDFGNVIVTKRAYSKRFGGRFLVDSSFVDQLASILSSVRSTPIVWIGAGSDYSSLIVWGFFKDFEIDIAYPTVSYCSITIEGLV